MARMEESPSDRIFTPAVCGEDVYAVLLLKMLLQMKSIFPDRRTTRPSPVPTRHPAPTWPITTLFATRIFPPLRLVPEMLSTLPVPPPEAVVVPVFMSMKLP